jgi:2-polyprenyl-3-methyl-5-hydroxy-6-metoxy-1,4-benzoquinol methylase
MDNIHHDDSPLPGELCLVCSYPGRPQIKYSFQTHSIYQCPLCNLLFLYPQPTSQELHQLYNSEEYFFNTQFYTDNNNLLFGYADYFAERFNKQKHFGRIAAQCMQMLVESDHPKREGYYKLQEIGCGPGFFLDAAREVGFEVHGIEFNPEILRYRSKKNTLPIQIADYENIGQELTPQYDCIVMLDVVEHFRNPAAVVQSAHKALHPGGLFVITTVDSGSVISRILGKRLEDFRRLREHLYFFNRDNMNILLRQNGFSVCATKSVGHTFRIDHLLNRITLMYAMPLSRLKISSSFLKRFGRKSIYINPHTKMIVYARKHTA